MDNFPSILAAHELFAQIGDPNLVVVDCRFALNQPQLGQSQYLAGHLPGAYYLDLNQDLSSPVQEHGGRHPLPDPQVFSRKLAQMGIQHPGGQQQIVAYDDSRFAFAARFWWLMKFYGYGPVAVLDGGLKAWEALGYPMTTDSPPVRSGDFIPQLQTDWIVDIEQVNLAPLRSQILVDSREPSRYRGEEEPIDPIAGHIPGAVNLPWQSVTDANGMALSPAEQRARWQSLPDATETIVYCGSGVTACVNLLSRAIADLPPVKLYPGSWSDWCSYCT